MARGAAPPLRVTLHGEHVADLTTSRRGLTLTYREELAAGLGVGGLCLSVALPVTTRPYHGDPVLNWCEGLLPEGETRTTLEQRFGVRRGDTFALLAALGRDCAGAVAFSADEEAAASEHSVPMSRADLAEAVAQLPRRPLGVDEQVRASLGGLQAKLLLVRTELGWARPHERMPSTHILKPDPRDLARSGLVVGEALVLRAASLIQMPAATVELTAIDGRPVLVVERYDRRLGPQGVVRIHQEDGCQALGIDPSGPHKYQYDGAGAPSYARLARVLSDHAVDADAELVRLGEAMTLNVAVGNTDGHARNHSFLLADGVVTLAPLYDVAPTFLFVNGQTLGLWVDDQPYLRFATRGHLVREMQRWGVPAPRAEQTVERTLTALRVSLPVAAEALAPYVEDELLQATCTQLEKLWTTNGLPG